MQNYVSSRTLCILFKNINDRILVCDSFARKKTFSFDVFILGKFLNLFGLSTSKLAPVVNFIEFTNH